jgi:hypothetical protein
MCPQINGYTLPRGPLFKGHGPTFQRAWAQHGPTFQRAWAHHSRGMGPPFKGHGLLGHKLPYPTGSHPRPSSSSHPYNCGLMVGKPSQCKGPQCKGPQCKGPQVSMQPRRIVDTNCKPDSKVHCTLRPTSRCTGLFDKVHRAISRHFESNDTMSVTFQRHGCFRRNGTVEL